MNPPWALKDSLLSLKHFFFTQRRVSGFPPLGTFPYFTIGRMDRKGLDSTVLNTLCIVSKCYYFKRLVAGIRWLFFAIFYRPVWLVLTLNL